jgi:hypothetical protein
LSLQQPAYLQSSVGRPIAEGRGGERVNTLRIYDVSDVMKYQNAWSWVSAIPAKPGDTKAGERASDTSAHRPCLTTT